jgi:CheY-like chemotaxis protein
MMMKPPKPLNILVVDDVPQNLLAMQALLADERTTVLTAESAQAALEEATCDEHNEVCTASAAALSAIRRALDAR